MKTSSLLFTILAFFVSISLQAQEPFTIEIEPLTVNGAPNVHSYSWGKTSDGKWIIVGGRIDGLHQRQPFAAFLESSNNKNIYLLDPQTEQTWSASLQVLPPSIFEQLQSTNQEFHQRGNHLYVVGGYGYSATSNDHITYPNLTAIDIDGIANAMINGNNINSFFRQISNANLAVTGGQLNLLNDTFYLCGGQYFEGRYNPMGPTSGPGFIQEYTDEIRKFEIIDDGTQLSIDNYSAIFNTDDLHRRDFNMAPQFFPNGELGFTMFSGVFQQNLDLPFLNSVDITSTGYTVNNVFNQYLSQYHSAKLPIFDSTNNAMHTIFFGGISQYTLDANGNLIQDNNVPFVKTISKVSRFSDGSMTESKLTIEMPTLLGSGAEFIPITDSVYFLNNDIVNLNLLPTGNTLIGYIYGGIESSQANIFFINNGTQSSASNLIFKVYINKSILDNSEITIDGDAIYNLVVYPNPTKDIFTIDLFIPNTNPHLIEIVDMGGRSIKKLEVNRSIGRHKIQIDLSNISAGEYFVTIKDKSHFSKTKIIKL